MRYIFGRWNSIYCFSFHLVPTLFFFQVLKKPSEMLHLFCVKDIWMYVNIIFHFHFVMKKLSLFHYYKILVFRSPFGRQIIPESFSQLEKVTDFLSKSSRWQLDIEFKLKDDSISLNYSLTTTFYFLVINYILTLCPWQLLSN